MKKDCCHYNPFVFRNVNTHIRAEGHEKWLCRSKTITRGHHNAGLCHKPCTQRKKSCGLFYCLHENKHNTWFAQGQSLYAAINTQFIGDDKKNKVTVLRLRVKVELLVITAAVYSCMKNVSCMLRDKSHCSLFVHMFTETYGTRDTLLGWTDNRFLIVYLNVDLTNIFHNAFHFYSLWFD